MGDQRDTGPDEAADTEGWHDDPGPTSPSDLEIESEFGEGGAAEEREEDEEEPKSGAGYGNNSEVPPPPD